MHDHVDGGEHLLPCRGVWKLQPGHQHHRLDPPHRIRRRRGVHGRQRPIVASVHRLQHVQRLGTAHLADHDPVGPHAKRVSHQRAELDRPPALDVRRPRLQARHVRLGQTQLGRVLNRDDAFVTPDVCRHCVQERRLAGSGAAADNDVQPAPHARAQQLGLGRRQRTPRKHVVDRKTLGREPPDRQQRPVQRDRRKHRVDAAAVGQARVDHRTGLVDAPADRGHDPLDHMAQVRLVLEPNLLPPQQPAPLGVHVIWPVRDHLGHVWVAHQRLERPRAERVVEHGLDQSIEVTRRQRHLAAQ